ncbi:lecithin retinol acyltransferase family protein [Trinickia mobilis]|uniref:lecithin retinol acyltransferase family protein n=1 Tax=Trinickia mobilis TaxID=2816356 RepID=UPI001A8FD2F4|nr:lecithin retinol acyltransferase family protein [Trinickia mobilis]
MSLELQLADAETAQAVRDAAQAEFALGAHLVTQRAGYSHHGIYVGNGKVIHYSGLCTSLHRGPVEEVTFERFAAGHLVFIAQDQQARYAGIEAVERARSRLGENDYRLLTNNCEHFCTWCVCGKGRSEQVRACVTHPAVAARAVMGMCRALIAARRAARRQYAQCAACALQAA